MNEKKRKIQPATDVIQKAGDSNEANRTQGKRLALRQATDRSAAQGRAGAAGARTPGRAAGGRHPRVPFLL